MSKTIRTSEATFQLIRDPSPALPWIEPARIQEALGAEASAETLMKALAPLTLFVVREELLRRLHSSGGRPALEGTTRRAKIPLRDEEWQKLEELAAVIASPGFAPSAGQIASVLLTLSLRAVAPRITSEQSDVATPII